LNGKRPCASPLLDDKLDRHVGNLNGKRPCASPLLGMGTARCGANRARSRRTRPALPVWQDMKCG
jgi:hypothetical protein